MKSKGRLIVSRAEYIRSVSCVVFALLLLFVVSVRTESASAATSQARCLPPSRNCLSGGTSNQSVAPVAKSTGTSVASKSRVAGKGGTKTLIYGLGDNASGCPDPTEPGCQVQFLQSTLEADGYAVDYSSTLPADISQYQVIWQFGSPTSIYEALPPGDIPRLVSFSQGGGALFLTGEYHGCCGIDASDESIVQGVLPSGNGIQVDDGSAFTSGPAQVNPNVTGGVATTPNQLSTWTFAGAGAIGGVPPNNQFTTYSDHVLGAVWPRTSSHGPLALLMDSDWLSPGYREDTSATAMIQNLEDFLAKTGPPSKNKKSTYKYCTGSLNPLIIGPSEVPFDPCMKVTDAYNGVSASSVKIVPPKITKHTTHSGGCPSSDSVFYSSLVCTESKPANYTTPGATGTSVTDYVTMTLIWDNVSVITSTPTIEEDTLTMNVTTLPDGSNKGSITDTCDFIELNGDRINGCV
jgi:hypothetical protein